MRAPGQSTHLVKFDQFDLGRYATGMPPVISNLYEAQTHLSQLIDRAAAGEEIIIAKNGVPLARLVRLRGPGVTRRPGRWEGRLRIADDFDAPLSAALLAAFGSTW